MSTFRCNLPARWITICALALLFLIASAGCDKNTSTPIATLASSQNYTTAVVSAKESSMPAESSRPSPAHSNQYQLTLTSSAFKPGQPIDRLYTGDGKDISPPLSWADVSGHAKELALIVDDPDAPSAAPWVHWVLYGLAPGYRSLPTGIPHGESLTRPIIAKQGPNSFRANNMGYRGPAPPPGDAPHHYHFTLYVLDKTLDLPPGLSKDQLVAAMQGHIIQQSTLIGTYGR